MKLTYYRINPNGNITLIVETPVKRESQAAVAAKLMALDKTAEQVGFLEMPLTKCAALRLQMMGGEFCGNASISAASLLMDKIGVPEKEENTVALEVSGADGLLDINVRADGEHSYTGTLPMPLPLEITANMFLHRCEVYELPLVRFPGICHALVRSEISPELGESAIKSWCSQLGSDALGLLFLDEEKGSMKPLVYVASTDTLVWENSCASGTCAVAACLAAECGETLSVKLAQPGGTLSVKAELEDGELMSLSLTGNAVIEECRTVVIPS